MRVLGVFVLILFLSSTFSLGMDMLLGFSLHQSIINLFNPFWVIETGEYVMLLFFLFITIVQQIVFIKKKKAEQKDPS